MSVRVRRALVKRGALSFSELMEAVGEPATKFAVRSALNFGRKKKEIVFRSDKYAMAPVRRNGARNAETPPPSRNGREAGSQRSSATTTAASE